VCGTIEEGIAKMMLALDEKMCYRFSLQWSVELRRCCLIVDFFQSRIAAKYFIGEDVLLMWWFRWLVCSFETVFLISIGAGTWTCIREVPG